MAIFNVSGQELLSAKNINGNELDYAYNLSGNVVYSKAHSVDLKVMTYNPQWFTNFNSQQAMQSSIISNNNADIIGFQEFSRNGSIPTMASNILTAYPYIFMSSHYNYLAMASKISISDVSMADYVTQKGETRAYMKGYIQVGGKTICWINTHLSYETVPKHGQMAELFEIAEQEEYCVITGDFNAYCLSIEDDDYINMYKPFVDAGYNLANCTAERGFTKTWTSSTTATSTSEMTYATDNIITSENIDMIDVKFDTTKFSYLNGQSIDHISIVASLLIN